MRNTFFTIFSAFILLTVGFSQTTPCNASQTTPVQLRAAGCKAEFFLIKDLAKEFLADTGIAINSKRSGNKVGIKLLDSGAIDFAFLSVPPRKLAKKFNIPPERTKDWQVMKIAKSPIVVVVNRNNKVTNMTLEQVKDVFRGEVTYWKELGGDDMQITVALLNKNLASGVLIDFRHATVGMMNSLTDKALRFDGPKKLGAYVALNKGAITAMGQASYSERYGTVLIVDGTAPTRENILQGKYPLATTYYIAFNKKSQDKIDTFLDYLRSEKGQTIIDKDFVAITNNGS